jgi:hypothetical protein
MLTPGVPQISVSLFSLSVSMTLLRPKSAIMISASSAGVRKRRFSGLRSEQHENKARSGIQLLTAVHDSYIVDVYHGFEDGANEICSITGREYVGQIQETGR